MRLIKRNIKNIKIFAISFLMLFSQLATSLAFVVQPASASSSGWLTPSATTAPNDWDVNIVANVQNSDDVYVSDDDGQRQGYKGFDIPALGSSEQVDGVEVRVEANSSDNEGCRIGLAVSWNGGVDYNTTAFSPLNNSDGIYSIGGSTNTLGRVWADVDLTNENFVVRITDDDPGTDCEQQAIASVDLIEVKIYRSDDNSDDSNGSENAATLSLVKKVEGSDNPATDWTLSATPTPASDGLDAISGFGGFESTVVEPNYDYILSETGPDGFAASDWACERYEGKGDSDITTIDGVTTISIAPGTDVTCTITNTLEPILNMLTITKDSRPNFFREFVFNVDGEKIYDEASKFLLADDGSGEGNSVSSDEVPNGVYTITEESIDGWTLTAINCEGSANYDTDLAENSLTVTFNGDESLDCVFVNEKSPDPVTVIASKIICTDESDLPNWGSGGPDITDETAENWVAQHESCSFAEGWEFEWSYDGVGNPGDNEEYGGDGWNTFGPTGSNGQASVDIENLKTTRLWFREVLQSGYLGFNYAVSGNSDDVTAEFYCNNDVLNYDNWDWIRNVKYGDEYNCVAWNIELGSLVVLKYEDLNGNGQRDDGEPKLDGWVMTLKDENGDEVATSTTGDFKKGRVLFDNLAPGKYMVCETLQEGWVNSQPGTDDACRKVKVEYGKTKWRAFGNYQLGSITIVKDTGSFNAGWKDFGYTGDLDNFKLNGGDNSETNSQTFTGLTLGDYTVTELDNPSNWDLTSLVCDSETVEISLGTKTVTISLTQSNEDVTCTFTNERQGQIKITKYEDLNGNGKQEQSEQGLADWQVFLYEPNDDDGWTQIQPRIVKTNSQGVANYTGLQPGTYLVCEEDVAGWVNTQPGNFAIWQDGRICQEIEVDYGDNVPVDFGNRQLGEVKVTKFHDVNENGIYEPETESTLEGWEINLDQFGRKFIIDGNTGDETGYSETQITGEDGTTTFEDLTPWPQGMYLLSENQQDGWQQTGIYCEYGGIGEIGTNGGIFGNQDSRHIKPPRGNDYYPVFVRSNDQLNCFVGNTYNPVLEISKTNDTPNPAVVGDTVTYTITVTVPEESGCVYREGPVVMWPWLSGLSEQLTRLPIFGVLPYGRNCASESSLYSGSTMPIYSIRDCEEECGGIAYGEVMVTDLPPEGFAYVPGSWTAYSNVRGDLGPAGAGVTTEPTYASPGQWNLTSVDSPFLVPGEVVTLTYQAVIGSNVTNGDYPDTAFVEGYSRGSFYEEGSTKIYGNLQIDEGNPFVGTEVTVLTIDVPEQGYVLGTSTLQVTGVPAILSPIFGVLLALGAAITVTNRKKRRHFLKGFGKSLASLGLAFVVSAFIFSSAYAAGLWTTNISTPEAFTTNGVVNIDYQVTSTDPGDTFEVDLMQNGGVILTQSVSTNYGDSGRFPIALTTEGTYTFKTSVLNNNGGEMKNSNEVTVTFDKTAPVAPTYDGVTRSGDIYTVNFTAPTGDVSKVNVYASTATSFNLDATTKVGEVAVTPGESSQFTYAASDSTQRYFAVTAADAAGNQSSAVGDEIVTTTIVPGATESSTAGATTDGARDEGTVSDEAAQTTTDLEGAVNVDTDEADDTGSIVVISGIMLFVVLVGAAYFIINTNRTRE